MKTKTQFTNRILSLVLSIMMVVSMLPMNALTASAAALTFEGETEPTTEPTTVPTESAVVCTCESDDPEWHTPFCDLYTAPENPACYCVEKCGDGWVNEWCEVCYFDLAACWASGEEEAAVYPSTPTYIASIGIAQDGSSGSTGVNDCKNELSGHTIIDRDLNDGAGGDYVYIGYKTTTDPSKAITGIVFRVGGDPPSSITYNGYTFYLVGGSGESNTASQGGWIDLNAYAGGDYIYMYVTRDSGYGAPLTTMTVDESSSKSGYSTGTNTSGNVIDLNQDAGGDYLYLHYKRFSATVNATYYYLTSSGSRTSNSYSLNVKNHLEALTTKPSYSTSVTYDGRTFTFKGWREDNTAGAATVTSPSATYITGDKTYRAVYAADVTLSYDANDGSGAPAAQKGTQYINAGSSSIAKQSVSFTIPNNTYTHSTKCFMGWSADKAAATAAYQPGGNITISSNTTLYAVYADHGYSNGVCDHCGIPVSGSVAVLSKNGKNVFAGTTLDAVITEAKKCVADDKAVVTILQDIDLGSSNLTINSGVFSLDLNGFELKSTYSSGVLSLSGESVNVTLQDSGETGKITATGRAIMADENATLTIVGGTISSKNYGIYALRGATVNISGGIISSSSSYGVYAYLNSDVNISGGTINGSNAVYVNNPVRGGTNGAVVNISGGTLNGTKFGVSVNEETGAWYKKIQVSINGGTINGGTRDIYAYYEYENHGWVKLNVNASGTGATFPDGLTAKSVYKGTLIPMNALLGEGAAYWAGNTMLAPADDATEITGLGDITVKDACTHESGTKQGYANRGDNHTFIWSCCKLEVIEGHTFTDTKCVCGAMDHTCQYTNGFCIEGCYEPAQLKDGYYQITNGGNLFWFAEYINTVDRTANAKLTADINLENRPWTPIGSTGESSNNFRGVFDGQNHTIEGLYVEGGRAGLGFFGEVRTGTVKNFTIYGEVVVNTEVDYVGGVIGSICGLNSTDHGLERNGAVIQNITSFVNVTAKAHGVGMIGGFVGYANHQTLIENCSWYGTFDAGIYRVDNGAGGFIGRIQESTSEVTIRNCAAYGTIKTNYAGDYNNTATIYMGGFLSFSNTGAKTTIENCLFAGKFERGENLTDQAELAAFGTLNSVNSIKNCYYLGDDGLAAVHSESPLNSNSENIEITSVTGEQLKSGEIAYLLQEANDIWGQTINSQNYPVLGGEKVYYGYDSCAENAVIGYTNNKNASAEKPAHSTGAVGDKVATCAASAYCSVCESYYGEVDTTNHDETVAYVNGFCPNCDAFEPATDSDSNNYYDIDNAGKLYWFAAQVNSGKTNINGELKANIVINDGVLAEMIRFTPDPSRFRLWTPIGTEDNAYIGDFCGLEHTVSGLYFNNNNAGYVGLFGYVASGMVNHVGVIDSYFNGSWAVGGVVGHNEGTVEYAYSNSYVGGTGCIGGIVGDNRGTVMYAYNLGSISGLSQVGGVVGANYNTVKNCYNVVSISGDSLFGDVVGDNSGTLEHCYYPADAETDELDGTTAKTWAQFKSGEVAYLLGRPFGQNIGTNSLPVLYGETVYAVHNCKNEVTYSNTNENLDHNYVNGTCTVCGDVLCEVAGHKDADNSGRCDTCNCLMQPALLRMVSISLKGNIALNYYMLLSDEVLSDSTAYMQFTMADGEIVKIPVSQGVKHEYYGETYYVFSCAVDAKEMTDNVVSQFFYDGGSTKEHTYNVQTYAKHILANYDDEATKNLITSMLNYGAASQTHFGYNTDNMANAELAAPDYSNVTISGFNATPGQGTELAKFYSASLILKSETTLRFFFTAPITATYNGQELEVKQRSGLYYVDVVGIAAKDLDENVTITINDGTNTAEVSFNPMSYCQGVLNDTTGAFDQEMKDLVSALYLYNQAANVYFKES